MKRLGTWRCAATFPRSSPLIEWSHFAPVEERARQHGVLIDIAQRTDEKTCASISDLHNLMPSGCELMINQGSCPPMGVEELDWSQLTLQIVLALQNTLRGGDYGNWESPFFGCGNCRGIFVPVGVGAGHGYGDPGNKDETTRIHRRVPALGDAFIVM